MAEWLCRALKPGQQTLDAIGGAHKLQGWDGNILTGEEVLFRCYTVGAFVLTFEQIVEGRSSNLSSCESETVLTTLASKWSRSSN